MSLTTKSKRNGNDELPTDRVAVKIIRNSRTIHSPRSQRSNSPTKQPVTKVSKLVYETKRHPTEAVLRSVHSFRRPLGTSNSPERKGQRQINDEAAIRGSKQSSIISKLKSSSYVDSEKRENFPVPRPKLQHVLIQNKLEIRKDVDEIHKLLQEHSGNNLEDIQREYIQNQFESATEPNGGLQSTEKIYNAKMDQPSTLCTVRSRTDPNMTGRGRSRSDSSTGGSNRKSIRSKSSVAGSNQAEIMAVSNVSPKHRSYDPEKARKYIQEQKERRKVQAATEKSVPSKIERDEIRKRLESLRKNTLTILQKNVKRARKKSGNEKASVPNVEIAISSNIGKNVHETYGHQSPKQCFILDQPSPEKQEEPLRTAYNDADIPKVAITHKKLTNQVKPLQTSERNRNINQTLKNKKIGLLRKTEEDLSGRYESIDVSELAIDKENVFVVPHTKTIGTKPTSPKSPVLGTNMHQVSIALESPFPELELNVPDVKLKPKQRPSVAEKSIQAEPPLPVKHALPYWLQPTPVQLYPYNFIKAVRKKLEAITNPVLTTKDQQTETDHNQISATTATQKPLPAATLPLGVAARRRLLSRRNLNEVSSINMEHGSGHKLSSASSVFTPFLNSPAMPADPKTIHQNLNQQPTTPPPTHDHSKSLSEITSSVTVNVPQSNTVSEVSSLNSDAARQPCAPSPRIDKAPRKQDDDTTASSSVFSSPEKRLPNARMQFEKGNQPETRNTDTFTIKPISNDREKNASPLSVDKINNLTLKSKSSTTSLVEVKSREDFEQMLQDFNESLSHVIQVNQQLQTALSKSPRSSSKSTVESVKTHYSDKYSQSRSASGSHKSSKYSSDFEKSLSLTPLNDDTSLEIAEADTKSKNKSSVVEGKQSSSTSIRTLTENKSLDWEERTKVLDNDNFSSVSLKEASMPAPIVEDTTKNSSNYTEEFVDSIENTSRTYMKVFTSPNHQQPLQDSNNFSKDSLEIQRDDTKEETELRESPYTKEDVIRNQINVIRGDGIDPPYRQLDILVSHRLQSNPSTLRMTDDSVSHRPVLNSSLGSDIFAIFNQSEMELSIVSQSSRPTEAQLNYSTLGLYEQLIKTEATKTEHLTTLLKIREKSLLDRTRGQIALLEIQKEKCRAKGLTVQTSIIKRKQRAILMKMEKEREEIRRVLKLSEKDSMHKQHCQPLRVPKIPELPTSMDISFRKNSYSRNEIESSRRIVRGYELDTSQNLETLLLSRELELKKRREHVERLLQWHQRLDKEEEEVLKIEEMLYKYNQQIESQHELSWKHSIERKKERKLMDINKSLRELQSISTNSGNETGTSNETRKDYVRTSGRKLNKLWCRLTGRKEIRFDQSKKYKLTKTDLEKLYEDAKVAVLTDFNENAPMSILTDQSKCNQSTESLVPMLEVAVGSNDTDIPRLNLNFSSGASECELPETMQPVDDVTFTRVETVLEKTQSETSDCGQNSADNVKPSQMNVSSNGSSTASRSYSEFNDPKAKSPIIDTDADKPTASDYTNDSEVIQTDNSTRCSNMNNLIECSKEELLSIPVEQSVVGSEAVANKSNVDFPLMSLTYATDSNRHDEIACGSSGIDANYEENKSAKNLASNIVTAIACRDQLDDKINESLLMIEDISAPKLESTEDIIDEQISEGTHLESQSSAHDANICEDIKKSTDESAENEDQRKPSVLEKRLIDLEQSLIELNNSFERVLSPDASSKTTVANNTDQTDVYEEKIVQAQDPSTTKVTVKDFLLNPEVTSSLMPDIINEVELRRRQQILVESDIIQLENAVPYALLREIPNKPPPPYVPPAHGSPMTTIFPSEARIKDITFRRTKELYEEINGNYNSPEKHTSILDENITNIYERIILDICKECVFDYQPTFTDTLVVVGNYKMPLALYNPPNRLKCVQEFVYKRVRKLLNMDKRQKRVNSIFSLGRRKRDHVDEILIQELFEEEHKWTNFDFEEEQVKENVIDEVFEEIVKDLIDNFEEWHAQQHKTIEDNDRVKLVCKESFADLNGD